MDGDERVPHYMTITMYGTDTRGDSRRVKAWFDENDIAYDYVDLADDPQAVELVLERTEGARKIPVIVFPDDSQLVEPTDAQLSAHVAALVDAGVDLARASADVASAGGEAEIERLPVIENVHLGRFELLGQGSVISFATYRSRDDGAIVVPHVETAPEHRGQDHAAELMEGLLAIIRADGRRIVPLCPFAAGHIRDNPQHHDLLAAR